MEILKYYTIKESIAHRLQFFIDMPSVYDEQSLKIFKEEILITRDCLNAALISLLTDYSNTSKLKNFLETLNTLFWQNHFPESVSESMTFFSSNEWNAIKDQARALIPLFKN